MVNLVIEQPYFLVGTGCLVTSIFLLKNLTTPPRTVVLRPSNPSFTTQTKRQQRFSSLSNVCNEGIWLPIFSLSPQEEFLEKQMMRDTWPRTFLLVVTHKNFSALLVRPILLNGCPHSFSNPSFTTQTKRQQRFSLLSNVCNEGIWLPIFSLSPQEEFLEKQMMRDTWPRTFLLVVTHKNFSALLVRPILLNGCPHSFSNPSFTTQTKRQQRFSLLSNVCGR